MFGISGHSVPGFFLMPEDQHIDRIGCLFVAVQRDIARVAKADYQLAQLRLLGKWTPGIRACFQEQELLINGLARTPGGLGILFCQKLTASFQTPNCALGDNYSWHSGCPASVSVPHVFNQVRTSCPLRWRPVS